MTDCSVRVAPGGTSERYLARSKFLKGHGDMKFSGTISFLSLFIFVFPFSLISSLYLSISPPSLPLFHPLKWHFLCRSDFKLSCVLEDDLELLILLPPPGGVVGFWVCTLTSALLVSI